MLKKSTLKKVMFVLVFCACIPPIFYIKNFYNYSISDETSDWGAFSDFLGGVWNPICSLANLLVLIWLTLTVKEIEAKREKNKLSIEKGFSISQLRLETYKDLLLKLQDYETEAIHVYDMADKKRDCEITPLKFKMSANRIKEVFRNYLFLFKKTFNEKNIKSIEDALDGLVEVYITYNSAINQNEFDKIKYEKYIKKLKSEKNKLFSLIQKKIDNDFDINSKLKNE